MARPGQVGTTQTPAPTATAGGSPAVRRLVALAAASLALLTGCATVSYRSEPVLVQSRYAAIENFSDAPITPEQVDGLLAEVAQILAVALDPATPRARIVVTTPTRIAQLYRATSVVLPHGSDAAGLYFPHANLVLVPAFDRTLLGHELAHYLTDHYLPQTPADRWEAIAEMVEHRLRPIHAGTHPVVPAGVPASHAE